MTPPVRSLVVIVGPPAVGKMAVGRALAELTGLPLFHNHMSIELVLPFFAFGSAPFSRLVGGFREQLFAEVAASELPGLIFTWVWDFDDPSDLRYIEGVRHRFENAGARCVFVELRSDLETRLVRNRTELRLAEKPSKRDVEQSEARLRAAETRHRMNSNNDFPFPEHLAIDNSRLQPDEVARRISDHFGLAPSG
jgi:hypothetical protein